MAPRLKVFITSDGLTDYVVATSSRPKALAAWGSHQDLFKTGLAHETDDPELVKAATQRPGEVLRRPAATRADLANLKGVRKAAPASKVVPLKPATKAAPPEPKAPSKAALKKVADLEKKLAALDAERAKAVRKLELRRAALEREAEAAVAQYRAERARWEAALSAARRALG